MKAFIDEFLAQKRLAMLGVSRDKNEFSREVFKEFRKREYEVVPVNPEVEAIEDVKCFHHVKDITPPVDTAFIILPPAVINQAVRECVEANITRIWVHSATTNVVSDEVTQLCASKNISIIRGYCPFMFLPNTMFLHSLHGLFLKLTGKYPK